MTHANGARRSRLGGSRVFGLDPAARKDFTGFVSHIHFIGGEKGGVGKSVVARLLAQWFIDRSLPFAGVDGDLSHGALVRFYAEFSQAVDLNDSGSADQILDRALGADRRVLIDLPAQSARSLWAWLSGADVLSLAKEMGIRLSFWHVSDGGFASVGEIEKALDLFGDQIEHKVVRNHGRSKDFSQFDESNAKRRLDQLGGKTIDLPELDAAAMYKVDRLGSSFWAAIHSSDGEGLKLLDRQRVRLWLERCYRQLETLQGAL
jgi:hypothetical protein